MPRRPRTESASSIYHIVARGTAHQIIFETDDDRAFFMYRLDTRMNEAKGELLAWCLMSNHVHLLVKMSLAELSALLRSLLAEYASYFNRVHGRSGSLFEGRFKSEGIDTDEYLLSAIRYIHRNPLKAGLAKGLSFPWSSYDSYLGSGKWTNTAFALDIFGGVCQFIQFHESGDDPSCLDIDDKPHRVPTDSEALRIANEILGDSGPSALKSAGKSERDLGVVQLKQAGLSVRQIQRLTGISTGVISRAGR